MEFRSRSWRRHRRERSSWAPLLRWLAVLGLVGLAAVGGPHVFRLVDPDAGPVAGASFTATLARPIDGDSFEVRDPEGRVIEVRLEGVDCPELDQPYGPEARAWTTERLASGSFVVWPGPLDRFERRLARIDTQGMDLALDLIEAGLAWVDPRFVDAPGTRRRIAQQARAREARRGLWAATTEPEPPWDFRRRTRAAELEKEHR